MSIQQTIDDLSRKQKVEIASFGSGGFILLVAILMYISGTRTIGGSLFVAGLVIAGLPYALYSYFHQKKYNQMEDEFPSFLRSLSESLKSGMSLPQAFQQTTRTDYGRLDPVIERAAHQLSWGVPFPEVMNRLADRIEGSGLIRRALYIILQSYESGGNIAETLDAIAANAAKIKEAEKEKKAVLKQQVYVIYAIHFLFIIIILALFVLLDSFILKLGSGIGGGGGGGVGGGFGGLGQVANFCTQVFIAEPICTLCPVFGMGDATSRICYYKALFLLMIIVSGIFNGLVAGEVVEGKVSAGLKHALIMAPLGFIIYLVAITVVL